MLNFIVSGNQTETSTYGTLPVFSCIYFSLNVVVHFMTHGLFIYLFLSFFIFLTEMYLM